MQRLKEKVYERAGNGDSGADDITAYRLGVVKQLQCIFGHLMKSRLQYCTPRGYWKSFRYKNLYIGPSAASFQNFCRMGDRPVNVREQRDAIEFFNGVVDCIDEGLDDAEVTSISDDNGRGVSLCRKQF